MYWVSFYWESFIKVSSKELGTQCHDEASPFRGASLVLLVLLLVLFVLVLFLLVLFLLVLHWCFTGASGAFPGASLVLLVLFLVLHWCFWCFYTGSYSTPHPI